MAHQANGELEKAKEDYCKVVELHPDEPGPSSNWNNTSSTDSFDGDRP
jgi:hypothetical protein